MTSREELIAQATSEDPGLRRQAAANYRAPAVCLRQLAEDTVREVRRAAAGNVRMPSDVFPRLANDSCGGVRKAAGSSRRCPDNVLLELAQDPDATVRHAVARNRSTPAVALAALIVRSGANPHWADTTIKFALRNWRTRELSLFDLPAFVISGRLRLPRDVDRWVHELKGEARAASFDRRLFERLLPQFAGTVGDLVNSVAGIAAGTQ